MIHSMRNMDFPGTSLLPNDRPTTGEMRREDVLAPLFTDRLPPTWQVEVDIDFMLGGPDAFVLVRAPDGKEALFAIEVKSKVEPRDVPRLADTLQRYTSGPRVVVAPFISRRTQQALRQAGIGYADLTGTVYLTAKEPALFIRDQGAIVDPWREGRAIHSLKGPTAGRVVRALCDFRPPFGLRRLAAQSRTPVSSVSRVTAFVDREGLVTRGERGEIAAVDWRGLLRRWAEDYSFTRSNRTSTYLEPRGLSQFLYKVEDLGRTYDRRYAITGSLAAAEVAPFAPPRLCTVYAENADRFAKELDLRPADAGANVLLAEPFNDVVFDRTWDKGDRVYAALSQVAADLLTGPGRGPGEGDELIRWMEGHEDEWRS